MHTYTHTHTHSHIKTHIPYTAISIGFFYTWNLKCSCKNTLSCIKTLNLDAQLSDQVNNDTNTNKNKQNPTPRDIEDTEV